MRWWPSAARKLLRQYLLGQSLGLTDLFHSCWLCICSLLLIIFLGLQSFYTVHCFPGIWTVLLDSPQSGWRWWNTWRNSSPGVCIKRSLLPWEDFGDAERAEAEQSGGHQRSGREWETHCYCPRLERGKWGCAGSKGLNFFWVSWVAWLWVVKILQEVKMLTYQSVIIPETTWPERVRI